MSLSIHGAASSDAKYIAGVAGLYTTSCIHCSHALDELKTNNSVDRKSTYGPLRDRPVAARSIIDERLLLCPQCGWWYRSYASTTTDYQHLRFYKSRAASVGVLKSFSAQDVSTPAEEVRAYLVGKYSSRFEVHPRVMEQTVESVFRSLGYETRLTAYSKDGGVDVVLQRDGQDVAVQVKRYKNKIGVEQIRELVGTLSLSPGYYGGMFVTSSSFTEGAESAASTANALGYRVELIDANAFFERLQLAQSADAETTRRRARQAARKATLTQYYNDSSRLEY